MTERAIAEWTLLQGGRVRLKGSRRFLSDIGDLPQGEVLIEVLDWIGTNLFPQDIARLSGLSALREFRVPGPLWNRNADGGKNLSTELGALDGVSTIESIVFSDHFLDNIRFDDSGLEAISSLTNLRELALRQSAVTGVGLRPFVNLEELDLTLTRLDDGGAASLAAMSKLRRLRIGDTLITDQAISHIARLASLEELDLHGTSVTDAGVVRLAKLANLRKIQLGGTAVTDGSVRALTRLPKLLELNLYRTGATNAGLDSLAELATLRAVDLRYTRVTPGGRGSFAGAPALNGVHFPLAVASSRLAPGRAPARRRRGRYRQLGSGGRRRRAIPIRPHPGARPGP